MEDATRQGASVQATNYWLAGVALIWLVFYFAGTVWSMNAFQESWFAEAGPGSNPPWYFIGQDLLGAIGSAAAAVLSVIIAFFSRRRLGAMVWGLLAVFSLTTVADLGEGVNILLHTGQVWQQGLAQSQWPDFDSYHASRWTSNFASLAVGVAIAIICHLQYKKALRGSGAAR